MADNFLQLNPNKTEVIIIAPDILVPEIMQHLGPLSSSVCPIVRNLGVLFDHSLSFNAHIKSLVKSCFFHLCNISKLRAVVSQADMEILIHSFISSRIDYCNALFLSLNKTVLHHLQSIQNAAARLLIRSN